MQRLLTYAYATSLLLGVLAILVVQYAESLTEDLFKDAAGIPNLISFAIALSLAIGTVLWLALFCPLAGKVRAAFIALLVLPTIAVGMSAKRFDLSGNMFPTLLFKEERLIEETPVAAAPESLPSPTSTDVLEYRGPERDGVFPADVLPAGFPDDPNLVEAWRRPIGLGYAGISVLGRFVITMDQQLEHERILCVAADSGKMIWEHKSMARFSEAFGGDGPRSTPTIHEGRVYAYGATGLLTCVDLLTGEEVWQTDTLGDMDLQPVYWGQCGSPLIFNDKVIVGTGGPNAQQANGLAFYDIATGELLARSDGRTKPFGEIEDDGEQEQNAVGYSSPMVATLAGQTVILNFEGYGLRLHDPDTAASLAFFEWTNGPRVNVAQPLVFGDDRIFLAASYGTGAVMLDVSREGDEWTLEPLWESMKMRAKFMSPIVHEGYIYGLDEGIMACLDAEDGKREWKRGRYGHGQIMLAGDTIIVLAEDGELVAVEATPEEHRELMELPLFDTSRNWNPPTAANGAIYARSHEEMVKLVSPSAVNEAPAEPADNVSVDASQTPIGDAASPPT